MSLSRTVSDIFSVKESRDFEILVRGHTRSLEMAPFGRSQTSSYQHSIVTLALSCIISEIKRDMVENRDLFISPAFDAPNRVVPVLSIAIRFGTEKTRMVCLSGGEKN